MNYNSAGINEHWLQRVAYGHHFAGREWTRKSGLLTATRDCLFTNILTVKPCINFKVKSYSCFEICRGSPQIINFNIDLQMITAVTSWRIKVYTK